MKMDAGQVKEIKEKQTRKRKSSNGDGSISKIVKNGKTYWQGYVTTGFDVSTNKQIKKTFSAKSEKEAKAKRDIIKKKVSENINVLATKNKTTSLFIKEFLDNFLQYGIERQSYLLYNSYYDLYIKNSTLGQMKFEDIETRHLQNFIAELAKKRFAPKTIKNIFIPIKLAFQYAYEEKYIAKNNCTNVKFPKQEQTEYNTLNKEDFMKIINETKKCEYHIAFRLLTYGLRISEMLGIRWQDFDPETATLSINKQLYFEKGKEGTLLDLKTDSSVRVIPISEEMVEALKTHKEKQDKRKNKSNNKKEYNKNNLIVCTKNGKPVRHGMFRTCFSSMLKKLDLQKIRVHDTRHSFCSIALDGGMTVKQVSNAAGHSNISTTSRYLHSNLDQQREGILKLGI